MNARLRRRTLLQAAGAAAALPRVALAQPKPDKLVFLGDTGPWHGCLLEEVGPAFEKETGTRIEFNLLPIDALNTRARVELSAGTGTIDILQFNAISAGWLAPYLEDHAAWLAKADNPYAAEFDWNDHLPAVQQMSSYKDKLLGIPYRATMNVLHYQKPLLEQAGIARPPETFAEFLAAAQAVTKAGAPGRYGFGAMARQGPAMVGSWQSWLFSNGGFHFNDQTMEIGINQTKAVEALAFYGELLTRHQVMAPDSTTWEFDEIIGNGQNDRYAMASTLAPYGTLLNDPKLSRTAGRWAASPQPGAHALSEGRVTLGGWTFGLPSSSRHKELAFRFIQMACSKPWAIRSMERGNLPPRVSVLNRPEVAERFPWAPAAAVALQTARLDPSHPIWPTLELQLRPAISQVLLGQQDAKTALDAVAVNWQRSLRRAGLI